MPTLRSPAIVALVSSGCYLASLVQPALIFRMDNGEINAMAGWLAALMGWTGLFVFNFAWLANVLYAFGLLMLVLGLARAAAVLGVLALVLALHTFMLFGRELVADEGGVRHQTLSALGPGFYFWIGAIAILAAAAVVGFLQKRAA